MNQINSIIYEPDYIIANNEILTSLCVYYDKIILYSHKSLDEELDMILDEKKAGYEKKVFYIREILKTLAQENVVDFYTYDSVDKLDSPLKHVKTGISDMATKDGRIYLDVDFESMDYVPDILRCVEDGEISGERLLRSMSIDFLSSALNIPKLMIDERLYQAFSTANGIADKLAIQSLCNISLPRLSMTKLDDVIYLRKMLKDELSEFRAGVLQLTYLLCKSVDITNKKDIQYEIDLLVNTKIKAAVIDVENRIKQSNKSIIYKAIVKGSQFLLHAGLVSKGMSSAKNVVDKGSDFLSTFSNDPVSKSPEEKMAGYLLSINNYFTTPML